VEEEDENVEDSEEFEKEEDGEGEAEDEGEGAESDNDATAVMILEEYWKPPAGKGIKSQEVHSQRIYKVQVREGGKLKNVQLVAEDQYKPKVAQKYADVNSFYTRVLASWREKYPQPPIKGKRNK
jgi:hypothetical protein